MTTDPGLTTMPRVAPSWLDLREPADAQARSRELAGLLRLRDPALIWDLGCGTGAMGRWLAPRVPVKQHWILCDRDGELLERANIDCATVETRACDVTRLSAPDLAEADLVTCSALLDLLTAEEVDRLAVACAGARCPALLTLSVVGRVELVPEHPFDALFQAAFNDHQRRTVQGRRLLGPDAVDAVVEAFTRQGATVTARPSPWRLEAGELFDQWFSGWVSAACEQEPDLVALAGPYQHERGSTAVVHHSDLLANWE